MRGRFATAAVAGGLAGAIVAALLNVLVVPDRPADALGARWTTPLAATTGGTHTLAFDRPTVRVLVVAWTTDLVDSWQVRELAWGRVSPHRPARLMCVGRPDGGVDYVLGPAPAPDAGTAPFVRWEITPELGRTGSTYRTDGHIARPGTCNDVYILDRIAGMCDGNASGGADGWTCDLHADGWTCPPGRTACGGLRGTDVVRLAFRPGDEGVDAIIAVEGAGPAMRIRVMAHRLCGAASADVGAWAPLDCTQTPDDGVAYVDWLPEPTEAGADMVAALDRIRRDYLEPLIASSVMAGRTLALGILGRFDDPNTRRYILERRLKPMHDAHNVPMGPTDRRADGGVYFSVIDLADYRPMTTYWWCREIDASRDRADRLWMRQRCALAVWWYGHDILRTNRGLWRHFTVAPLEMLYVDPKGALTYGRSAGLTPAVTHGWVRRGEDAFGPKRAEFVVETWTDGSRSATRMGWADRIYPYMHDRREEPDYDRYGDVTWADMTTIGADGGRRIYYGVLTGGGTIDIRETMPAGVLADRTSMYCPAAAEDDPGRCVARALAAYLGGTPHAEFDAGTPGWMHIFRDRCGWWPGLNDAAADENDPFRWRFPYCVGRTGAATGVTSPDGVVRVWHPQSIWTDFVPLVPYDPDAEGYIDPARVDGGIYLAPLTGVVAVGVGQDGRMRERWVYVPWHLAFEATATMTPGRMAEIPEGLNVIGVRVGRRQWLLMSRDAWTGAVEVTPPNERDVIPDAPVPAYDAWDVRAPLATTWSVVMFGDACDAPALGERNCILGHGNPLVFVREDAWGTPHPWFVRGLWVREPGWICVGAARMDGMDLGAGGQRFRCLEDVPGGVMFMERATAQYGYDMWLLFAARPAPPPGEDPHCYLVHYLAYRNQILGAWKLEMTAREADGGGTRHLDPCAAAAVRVDEKRVVIYGRQGFVLVLWRKALEDCNPDPVRTPRVCGTVEIDESRPDVWAVHAALEPATGLAGNIPYVLRWRGAARGEIRGNREWNRFCLDARGRPAMCRAWVYFTDGMSVVRVLPPVGPPQWPLHPFLLVTRERLPVAGELERVWVLGFMPWPWIRTPFPPNGDDVPGLVFHLGMRLFVGTRARAWGLSIPGVFGHALGAPVVYLHRSAADIVPPRPPDTDEDGFAPPRYVALVVLPDAGDRPRMRVEWSPLPWVFAYLRVDYMMRYYDEFYDNRPILLSGGGR